MRPPILYLDQKYLGLVSGRLRNYVRKSPRLYQFSCPACGDSKRDPRKARCYAFETEDRLRVHCHKCGYSTTFARMLRGMDEEMYREYLLEAYEDKPKPRSDNFDRMSEIAAETPRPPERVDLPRLSELPHDHPAAELARRRMIPAERWRDLYYAYDFRAWANTHVPGRYQEREQPEPRLVIPFWSRGERRLIGFQGRLMGPGDPSAKYLTAALDKTVPFLYGYDLMDPDRRVVAVEGPIDSMFLRNAVASAGGSITRELDRTGLPKGSFVISYDNEPRSQVTVDKIMRAVRANFPVFIWPRSVLEKDFNDYFCRLVSGGKTPDDAGQAIRDMIESRTYQGLEAELELDSWKKVA